MTARAAALAVIEQEHHALARVLHTLQKFLERVETGVATPEFDMFSAALYYIDEFQERSHHPKEEAFLFKSLSAATSEFDSVIAELQAGHRHGAQAMAALYRALVHYQGGAPDGIKSFRACVDAYAQAMFEHMRAEEDLFAKCTTALNDDAWARIAAAFGENDDPLFGQNRREAFARLFHRIQRLTPRKLKRGMTGESQSATTATVRQ